MFFVWSDAGFSLYRIQGAVSSPETSPSKAGSSHSGMFNKVNSPVTKIQTAGGRALSSSEQGQPIHLPVVWPMTEYYAEISPNIRCTQYII
jgi:hypothetical protein